MSTLLLADNDASVRATLARSLAGHGFTVIATANGREAVNVLKSREVDILVTELDMPVMDGFALLAQVEKIAPNLPTLVLTALVGDFDEQLSELRPVKILYKPLSVKALAAEAREALTESARGSISGISLPSLLQILQWEKKSCSVRVRSDANRGRLDFLSGELVNAYMYGTQLEGEAAAYEVFTWEDIVTEIERSHPETRRLIKTPLQNLLIDAMRLKDERAQAAPVATPTPDQESEWVGETESDMFFRKKRRDAPPPPEQEAETEPVREPVAVGIGADVRGERLEQLRETAKRDADAVLSEKPDTLPPASTRDEKLDIQPPPPEPRVEDTTVAATAAPAKEEKPMANINGDLQKLIDGVDGAMAAMLVDYKSGMALGMAGSGINLEIAAAGNTQVVRAKMKTMKDLGLKGEIEDILITLQSQYHLLRILPGQEMFMYLVLDREKANLAMARYRLRSVTDMVTV